MGSESDYCCFIIPETGDEHCGGIESGFYNIFSDPRQIPLLREYYGNVLTLEDIISNIQGSFGQYICKKKDS